jgi:hypothetical protein
MYIDIYITMCMAILVEYPVMLVGMYQYKDGTTGYRYRGFDTARVDNRWCYSYKLCEDGYKECPMMSTLK